MCSLTLLTELIPNYWGHLDIAGLPEKIHIMASNLYMNMRPPASPVTENLPGNGDRFHPAVKKSSSLDLSLLTSEKFAAVRLNVTNAIERGIDVPKGAGVGVLPLGTGSALPSKYRNGWHTNFFENSSFLYLSPIFSASSTLIQIPGWGDILLDASEGTWGQLVRYFGMDDTSSPNVWDVLRNLKRIFISNIHADHHLGVSVILAKRRSVCILSAVHCGPQLIFASDYPVTHRVTLSCHDSWSKHVPPRIVGYSRFRTE